MRIIKFRAWDKDKQLMIIVHSLSFWTRGFGKNKKTYTTTDARKEQPIMQFIGLKDKNKKEIYESDIVKLKYNCKGVVEWNNEQACFAIVNKKQKWNTTDLYRETMEVIGNIHENPELLGDKK